MIFLSFLANIKKYKYLYLLGIYIATILVFTSYYYYSQNKILKLEPYKKSYDELVVKYDTDIKYLKDTYNKQLSIERDGFESYKTQCKTLQKLDNTAKKTPSKVEKLINKNSQMRLDCFEAASGNKDKVNDLCKNYYKE